MPEQSPRLIRVRMTDGFELDPMPENRIVELIRHGIIDRDDLIQRVGSERWRRAIEAGEGLFPAASNIPPALDHAPPALDHAPPALHHTPPALHHAPPPAVTQQQGSPAQESWAGFPAAQVLGERAAVGSLQPESAIKPATESRGPPLLRKLATSRSIQIGALVVVPVLSFVAIPILPLAERSSADARVSEAELRARLAATGYTGFVVAEKLEAAAMVDLAGETGRAEQRLRSIEEIADGLMKQLTEAREVSASKAAVLSEITQLEELRRSLEKTGKKTGDVIDALASTREKLKRVQEYEREIPSLEERVGSANLRVAEADRVAGRLKRAQALTNDRDESARALAAATSDAADATIRVQTAFLWAAFAALLIDGAMVSAYFLFWRPKPAPMH